MNLTVDTHSHTLASGHAYSTMKEMAQAAAKRGLSALALTDHAPQMPGSAHLYYFQNFKVIPRVQSGVRILMGAEVNIMNTKGEVDLPDEIMDRLDIVVASIHLPCYGEGHTARENTRAYLKVMENRRIDIIGHPDDSRFPVNYEELVKEAAQSKILLEVNNSSLTPGGFRTGAWENLKKMLSYCEKYGVTVTTGSDAHVDADAGNFSNIQKLFEEIRFPKELVATTSAERLMSLLDR